MPSQPVPENEGCFYGAMVWLDDNDCTLIEGLLERELWGYKQGSKLYEYRVTANRYPNVLSAILAEPEVFGYTEAQVRLLCEAKSLSVDLTDVGPEAGQSRG